MKTILEKAYKVDKAEDEAGRAINIVNALIEALGDMCQATDTDACATMNLMIRLMVHNMKANGHGGCALSCMIEQIKYLGESDDKSSTTH